MYPRKLLQVFESVSRLIDAIILSLTQIASQQNVQLSLDADHFDVNVCDSLQYFFRLGIRGSLK